MTFLLAVDITCQYSAFQMVCGSIHKGRRKYNMMASASQSTRGVEQILTYTYLVTHDAVTYTLLKAMDFLPQISAMLGKKQIYEFQKIRFHCFLFFRILQVTSYSMQKRSLHIRKWWKSKQRELQIIILYFIKNV